MSRRIRVLLADDSAVIRRLLNDVLGSDPSLEVVGSQRNGAEAVAACGELRPDVVILDVEMPVMDGIEAVSRIRVFDRLTPIIMFSSLTARGAETTIDALSQGASDFAVKPSQIGHVDQAVEYIRRELIPKILHLGLRQQLRNLRPGTAVAERKTTTAEATIPIPLAIKAPAAVVRPRPQKTSGVDLVGIGASTGGPNALADVIQRIDGQITAPILIVQHMPPLFTQFLADRLNTMTSLDVKEAKDGEAIRRGMIRVAPGNFHMTVERHRTDQVIRLNQDAPVNSCRPAVDVLFKSLSKITGPRTLGVVLTGMGKDGTAGAHAIRESGGRIIAQDEQSSVVFGMPRAVIESNLANRILPIHEIGQAISASCSPTSTAIAAVC